MGALIRAKDWSTTPLGPIESWSTSLRMMVSFLLANRFPLLLWWGPDYISIYNDAYVPILGNKHPEALGQPVSECWSEVWHILQPLIDNPFKGGPATWMEDLQVEINRRGFVEETHFTVAYSPVPDETAPRGIGGVLATVHEITDKMIGERRVQVLRDLGVRAAESRTAEAACRIAAETLANHAKDIPFALIYLLDAAGRQVTLAGAAGIAIGESASPVLINLDESDGGWPVAAAVDSEALVTIADLPGRFGSVPSGPWSNPPDRAVILPIRSTKTHELAGVFIAGVSARIQLDERYRTFFELVASQLATAIANARSYEEERRRAEALAEIDRAKTAFFSNVSHEFRTPLTLMLGPIEEMLANGASATISDEQRRELNVVHRNSLRLLRLVNTLLDFSRIEAGRMQACYQPLDLAALTADLAAGFRSAIERAGLTLDVVCEPLPEPVFVDRDMWEKVVLNLMSNAFKFTFKGGIAVTLRAEQANAVLSVRDTGVGIPEGELPRLFERFHRIEGQRSRSFEGSGIGLALVDELVRLHGGSISVSSKVGQGTEFTVVLPFGSAHLDAEHVNATPSSVSTATGVDTFVQEALRWLPGTTDDTAAPVGPASHLSVLVADDNADMRDYVYRLLSRRYEVIAVADGEAALTAIHKRRPDLVLSDVMMPGLDGFGLLRAIREDPQLHDLPVIVLSARAGEDASAEGLSAGANDYLVKPFSARELLACVEGNLKLAEQRRKVSAELQDSERRFRALVNASSDAVYRMSADWRELRSFVYRDFVADPKDPNWLDKYIDPDDQPGVIAAIGDAIRTKEVFESEHRVRRLDGTLGWAYTRAVPLLDADGEIIEWFGMASDVTQRKETELALQSRTAQFETLLNEAPLGVYLVDADFRIRQVNPMALPVFSNVPDLIGRDLADVIHILWPAEYADEVVQRFRHTLETGEPYFVRERTEMRRDLGKQEIYRWQISRIELPEGRYGVVCYFWDVAAEVLARQAIVESEERLRVLNEQLEARVTQEVSAREQAQLRLTQAQRMEALGQLAGGIAHDFNNVLQAVSGGLALIQKRAEDPEIVRRFARMSTDAADRGAAITGRLLAFARRGELRAVAVPPQPLLENLSEMLAATLGADIAIELKVPADAPPLLADKAQLETVLVNLAVNARDAMPAGGTLVVSATPDGVTGSNAHTTGLKPGAYLRIELTDTGTGMNPATLARASEPFFTTKPVGQGTGLGLAMARGFAEQSGGGFAIRSTLGEGTTVTLWFPQADPAPDRAAQSGEKAKRASTAARILVVDDDAMVREVLAYQLTTLGYRITEASDGLAALARLDAGENIDLLVTDFSMPGMNGYLLIEEARLRQPMLPALLLTGYADAHIWNDIVIAEHEPTVMLRKPVSDSELAERVMAMLDRQNPNDPVAHYVQGPSMFH